MQQASITMVAKIFAQEARRIRRKRRKDDRQSTITMENHGALNMVRLQQAVGNRAVQRMLSQRAPVMRQEEMAHESEHAAGTPIEARLLSGASWVDEFPTSVEVSDLDSSFGSHAQRFITALEEAGASVDITATRRPAERAYLMHWAWKIAKQNYNARRVPAKEGVNIDWWHGNQADSRLAAQEMVEAYKINNLKIPPSLRSYHIVGKAIDMVVSWSGDLTIKNPKGTDILITTSPKNHTNAAIIAVGRAYKVIHFRNVSKDEVHWSVDGR